MKQFMGIADAHGVESFIEHDIKRLSLLIMRARANRQRHALVYTVSVGSAEEKKIKEYLMENKYIAALKYLKTLTTFAVEKSMIKIINYLPNPDLDTL